MHISRSSSTFGPLRSLDQFKKNPGNYFWRHTAGRVSMLARIPFYAAAAALQFAKMTVTLVVVAPFATLANCATERKYEKTLDRWTFCGAAKDGLIFLKILDKIGSSALGVIFAPPRQHIPFSKMLKKNLVVLRGDYHFNKKTDVVNSLSDVWKMLERRPEYSCHVFYHQHLNIRFQSPTTKAG